MVGMTHSLTTPHGPVQFEDLATLERLLQEQWDIEPERARLWSGIAAAEILNGEVFTVPQTTIKVERIP